MRVVVIALVIQTLAMHSFGDLECPADSIEYEPRSSTETINNEGLAVDTVGCVQCHVDVTEKGNPVRRFLSNISITSEEGSETSAVIEGLGEIAVFAEIPQPLLSPRPRPKEKAAGGCMCVWVWRGRGWWGSRRSPRGVRVWATGARALPRERAAAQFRMKQKAKPHPNGGRSLLDQVPVVVGVVRQ